MKGAHFSLVVLPQVSPQVNKGRRSLMMKGLEQSQLWPSWRSCS